MKALLLTTAILMPFLCSGCAPAKKASGPVIEFAHSIKDEVAKLFNQLFDLLGNAGDDVKDVPQDVCNTLQRQDVKDAMAVLDRLPIGLVAQELGLSPGQAARLATITAASPVLIIRWVATGVAGVTLLCQAFFPTEHKAGTAVVVLCDSKGCGPLKR